MDDLSKNLGITHGLLLLLYIANSGVISSVGQIPLKGNTQKSIAHVNQNTSCSILQKPRWRYWETLCPIAVKFGTYLLYDSSCI